MKICTGGTDRGFVTLLVMTLLLMMVALLMVESASVNRLRREMKQMETRQAQRLSGVTNQASAGKLHSR